MEDKGTGMGKPVSGETYGPLRWIPNDNWKHRSAGMTCGTCVFFVEKRKSNPDPEAFEDGKLFGRCRKHAPTLNGWPAVFSTDWCGDHKLDENKI
jgi:hypothetical protein